MISRSNRPPLRSYGIKNFRSGFSICPGGGVLCGFNGSFLHKECQEGAFLVRASGRRQGRLQDIPQGRLQGIPQGRLQDIPHCLLKVKAKGVIAGEWRLCKTQGGKGD